MHFHNEKCGFILCNINAFSIWDLVLTVDKLLCINLLKALLCNIV